MVFSTYLMTFLRDLALAVAVSLPLTIGWVFSRPYARQVDVHGVATDGTMPTDRFFLFFVAVVAVQLCVQLVVTLSSEVFRRSVSVSLALAFVLLNVSYTTGADFDQNYAHSAVLAAVFPAQWAYRAMAYLELAGNYFGYNCDADRFGIDATKIEVILGFLSTRDAGVPSYMACPAGDTKLYLTVSDKASLLAAIANVLYFAICTQVVLVLLVFLRGQKRVRRAYARLVQSIRTRCLKYWPW
jgi:hypothetical protein